MLIFIWHNNFCPTWTSKQDTICPREIINILKLLRLFLTASPRGPIPIFSHHHFISAISCSVSKSSQFPSCTGKYRLNKLKLAIKVYSKSPGNFQAGVMVFICYAHGHWKSFAWPCFQLNRTFDVHIPYKKKQLGLCPKLDNPRTINTQMSLVLLISRLVSFWSFAKLSYIWEWFFSCCHGQTK